jgi:hypothetical protein
MNYTVDGKNYIANEGYVFISKTTGIISKKLRLRKPDLLKNYDVIPEPVTEEIEEAETTETTETDHNNTLD